MRENSKHFKKNPNRNSESADRSDTERQYNNRQGESSSNEHRYVNIPVRRVSPDTDDQYMTNRRPAHDNTYGYSQSDYSATPYAYSQRPSNIQPDRPYYQNSQNQQNVYRTENQHYNGYIQNSTPQRVYMSSAPQKAEKKHGFGKFLLSVLLIASLLCGIVFGYAFTLCSKTNYIKSQRMFTAADVMYDDEVYNVLLVGTDRESNGASRSDTMLLLSIDRKNRQLKMTSFLRDMWVDVPDYGSAKLNAAYAYGGADLMMKTIENNFKLRIDNYILVNFDMFKALIDGLGGVDVEITENEASFINRTTHAKVNSGINHLNGDYALIYVRIRKLDSDFMRTQRQRKVMTAIIRQVQEQGIFSSASAASGVLPYITTDIPSLELTLKAFSALVYIGYESSQLQIPLNDAYSDRMVEGQEALVIDFERNIDALQDFIYG